MYSLHNSYSRTLVKRCINFVLNSHSSSLFGEDDSRLITSAIVLNTNAGLSNNKKQQIMTHHEPFCAQNES